MTSSLGEPRPEFALLVTDTPLNMMSMIGVIMWMGLVVKNAILLVETRMSDETREWRGSTQEDNNCVETIMLRSATSAAKRSTAAHFDLALSACDDGPR